MPSAQPTRNLQHAACAQKTCDGLVFLMQHATSGRERRVYKAAIEGLCERYGLVAFGLPAKHGDGGPT